MKLSIISVVYNDAAGLLKTWLSVKPQDLSDCEYLIIDGGSDDKTLDAISSIIRESKALGVNVRYISERDGGPYDAMNKGTVLSDGEYVMYLNAGDSFIDHTVVNAIISELAENPCDVLYGNTRAVNCGLYMDMPAGSIEEIKNHMCFCHQSSVIRRNIMLQYKFDINYKICADYDLFLRVYLDGKVFAYSDLYWCIFSFGGLSSNVRKSLEESFDIKKSKGLESGDRYVMSYGEKIKSIIRPIIPKWMMKFYLRRTGWKQIELT